MSRKIVRRALAGALFFVPLIAGTVYATTQNVDPAATWSAAQETQQGAPAVQEDPSLVDIRRAAGEAGSQASLLKNGTTQLVDGTTALNNGTTQLVDGTKAAQNGAAQLADGMVKLQAATGQMGNGATEIANGIDQAVGQFQNVEVIRGQLLTAINLAMSDPKLADVKPDLEDFKRQVETFKVDDNITSQMNKLRDGSRELANQLAVPGYGFHDGIYSATKGSKDLSAGLNDLSGGVDQALTGVRDLDNGAKKSTPWPKKTKPA
ncbi:putative membrane protein [Corynebacterium diphtheriae CDCE 8392]|nr:putative membrane protein [Corynebacterium diphtheriae CDCE 8392]